MSEPPRATPNQAQQTISATDGSTIRKVIQNQYITIYEASPALPIDHATLDAAHELLALLPLNDIPSRRSLSPESRMPWTPVAQFVGREADLKHVASLLMSGATTAAIVPTAATTGRGGMGKTSLAIEFVHRYGRYFAGGGLWLACADPRNIPGEIARCGGADCLALYTDRMGLPLLDQMQHVVGAWKSPLPRLLVFDHCEDRQILRDWRPTIGRCRILLTSRDTTKSQRISAFVVG